MGRGHPPELFTRYKQPCPLKLTESDLQGTLGTLTTEVIPPPVKVGYIFAESTTTQNFYETHRSLKNKSDELNVLSCEQSSKKIDD